MTKEEAKTLKPGDLVDTVLLDEPERNLTVLGVTNSGEEIFVDLGIPFPLYSSMCERSKT